MRHIEHKLPLVFKDYLEVSIRGRRAQSWENICELQGLRVCICQVCDEVGKYGPTRHVNHFAENAMDLAEFYDHMTALGAPHCVATVQALQATPCCAHNLLAGGGGTYACLIAGRKRWLGPVLCAVRRSLV